MILRCEPRTKEAMRLLMDGQRAFADMEEAGIRFDEPTYRRNVKRIDKRIAKLTGRMEKTKEWKEWNRLCRKVGKKVSFAGNDQQLARTLYEVCGHSATKFSAKKQQASVDDESLRSIGIPFTRDLLRVRKLLNARDNFLGNLAREAVDGVIHPFFNLNINITYRSSSDSPNWQNNPVRDPEQGAIIRSTLFPRFGHQIGETDLSGAEVKGACYYHQDPNMILYLTDKSKDMHRDSACDCYELAADQCTKKIRYYGKNGFVFPEFYGSYWKQVGPVLWKAAAGLELADGTPLRDHLADKGYRRLGTVDERTGRPQRGTFLAHIRDVEEMFWGERFPTYAKWKKEWWAQYLKHGYFDMLTGFRCSGPMARNDAVNYPVQGVSFHCLLWCLIQLNKWLRRERMDSRIIGQIHDSMVKDYHPDETRTVMLRTRDIITTELAQHWKWVIVPMEAEFEVAEVDKSWNDKQEVKL